MNIFNYIKKLSIWFFTLCVTLFILAYIGFFDSVQRVPPTVMGEVETNLRIDAEAGNPDAQNKLGTLLYKRDRRLNGDFVEAIMWLESANSQDHPIAQMNLAFAYKNGVGVNQNTEKAITLFHQSGLNYLRLNQPDYAMDSVQNIYKLNSIHPLKQDLIKAIKRFEETT